MKTFESIVELHYEKRKEYLLNISFSFPKVVVFLLNYISKCDADRVIFEAVCVAKCNEG